MTEYQPEELEQESAKLAAMISVLEEGVALADVNNVIVEVNASFSRFVDLKTLAPRAHEKGLELAYYVFPEVPETLIGDPGRLRQVIVNLVGNAIKFTEKGEIVLSVKGKPDKHDQACLRFTLTDTGIGIPSDRLGMVFEPFNQVDSSTVHQHGGAGLGLSISRHIVEMMGGQVWAQSEPGKGSIFRFTACFGRSATKPRKPIPVKSTDLMDLPVLIVDDNAAYRRILQEMLANYGMKPTSVNNGNEALAALEQALELGMPFALILMDVAMPEMDGFEATQIIREKEKAGRGHIPIVAMTAHAMKGDRERCLAAGMEDYISKPINVNKLYEIIEKFAAKSKRR